MVFDSVATVKYYQNNDIIKKGTVLYQANALGTTETILHLHALTVVTKSKNGDTDIRVVLHVAIQK